MSAAIGDSGISYDFFFYNAANEVWNGTVFVAWADVDFASYRVAATETGTSGEFPVPTPPTGATRYVMRERGATLALSYKAYADNLKLSADAATAATQATAAALDASKIPRAASPTTPGAPQAMHLENASGDTLASAREVHDGDAA
jgi:hypothetical protein